MQGIEFELQGQLYLLWMAEGQPRKALIRRRSQVTIGNDQDPLGALRRKSSSSSIPESDEATDNTTTAPSCCGEKMYPSNYKTLLVMTGLFKALQITQTTARY
ncbi:MAG: hypothetical protein ACR2PX_04370 [Endozoicomonas sp.]|uniref:hypothetical protein n=1 Tax=Endozoicomonas sp. TaxID=1892382 RepID=UPI003D9B375E